MPDHPPSPAAAERKPLAVWVRPMTWIFALAVLAYFFNPISTIALGILAAAIIASTLSPLLRYIPLPRGLAVAAVGLGLIVAVVIVAVSLSWPLAKPISKAVQDWPNTRQRVDQQLARISDSLKLKQPLTVEKLGEGIGDFMAGSGGQRFFSQSADVALGILISLVFTLIGSIFLLSEPPERLVKPALRLLVPRHRPTMEAVINDLAPRYRRWVIGTLTGMCVVFTASLIGYSSIGLKLALPMALLAGFAEIVPTVGPAVACAVAALFAFAIDSATKAVGVFVVYGIVQAVEAYFVLPLIMRGAVNMHPAVTLFTVILWGKILGVPGLMLAIPINLTIWTLLDHFRMRPHERAAGLRRPASAPEEEPQLTPPP